jgi:glutaredoxin
MKLDPVQLASLKRLRKYRDAPPTVRERVGMALMISLVLLIPFALVGAVFLWLGARSTLFLLAGLFLGAAAREIGAQRTFVRWWPYHRAVTDWNKVDELLAEAEQPAVGAAAAAPTQPVRKVNWSRAAAMAVGVFIVAVGAAFVVERVLAYTHNPARNNAPNSVVILTTSWCGYCRNLREHLTELNVPYVDLDVENTTEGRYAYMAVRGTGVPITVVGEQVIRGIGRDDGLPWRTIDTALTRAGYDAPQGRSGAPQQRDGDWVESEVRSRLP